MPSAPQPYYTYGSRFVCEENKVKRTLYGLDTGRQRWVTNNQFSFVTGGLLNGLVVLYCDSAQQGDDWVHDLDLAGLINGADKREQGYPDFGRKLEGFDEARDSWIVWSARRTKFNPGDVMSGYSQMVCVDVAETPIIVSPGRTFYKLTPTFLGIRDSKPYSRSITVNGQPISPSGPITVDFPGGWEDPRKSQVDFPKIVVRDTIVSFGSGPPTDAIPGNVTPPDAPAISGIVYFGPDVTYHWPHGWKLASIDGHRNIPGTSIHIYTLVYEFEWEVTP